MCCGGFYRHPDYKPGDVVLAPSGWQTKFVCGVPGLRKVDTQVAPMSAYLGVLGMPGFTAYAGLRVIGKPIKGDTVVVSAAAGAVGSLAGQLATIAGARAVGIAGGPNKCAFVKEELGFDIAVDYKATGFPEALAMACPDGVDVYFENVGGAVWQAGPSAPESICARAGQWDYCPLRRGIFQRRRPLAGGHAASHREAAYVARVHQL